MNSFVLLFTYKVLTYLPYILDPTDILVLLLYSIQFHYRATASSVLVQLKLLE